MSFDYLRDFFGRFRKNNRTRYTCIEMRAVALLQDINARRISIEGFGESMRAIDEEFHNLMYDAQKNAYVFDNDTPGWLNMFLGNKFRPWYRFHKSFIAARNNPKLTSDPRWHEVERRAAYEERSLMDAVEYCLNKYDRK